MKSYPFFVAAFVLLTGGSFAFGQESDQAIPSTELPNLQKVEFSISVRNLAEEFLTSKPTITALPMNVFLSCSIQFAMRGEHNPRMDREFLRFEKYKNRILNVGNQELSLYALKDGVLVGQDLEQWSLTTIKMSSKNRWIGEEAVSPLLLDTPNDFPPSIQKEGMRVMSYFTCQSVAPR